MGKVMLRVPENAWRKVYRCPICKKTPKVEATLTNGDAITSVVISCNYCGLRAPIEKWEEICGIVDNALD